MISYFAYGANMDPDHMARCCPRAVSHGRARLPGRAFRIAATGYGDAQPEAGGEIHGLLWTLTAEDEAALDRFEAVPEGLYWKEQVEVRDADDRATPAMLYRAADPAPGRPVPGYLERIIVIAEALDFPAPYLAGLRAALAG